jgi:trigger factor
MENTPVILPESMIKTEVDGRLRRIASYYGADPDIIRQMTDEDKMNEMREIAQKALHSRVILETLMEEQKIEVSDEEIEKEIENIASERDIDLDEVKKYYREDQAMFYLKEDIKERKIIDILFAENNLKQGKKENYLAFMSGNG